MRAFQISTLSFLVLFSLPGCWVGAAAVGGEAGYVASQESRTTGETIDDQLIVTKVKSKFFADPDVSGLNINVDSFKGEVTLKGFVKSDHEADKAIQLAENTTGVRGVRSKLVID